MQSRNQPFEPAFDHIRGFAAILILIYHAIQHLAGFMAHGSTFQESDRMQTHNPLFALLLEGHTAVGLFIVLSGFLFARSAIGREIDYGAFLKNRILRIYPLLLLLVTLILATRNDLSLQSLIMVILPTGYMPAIISMGVIGSMFWAVAVEFQFYLIFPFLARTMNEQGIKPLLAIIAVAILFRYGATQFGSNIRDISYWTSIGRIDQFLIGMIAARLHARHPVQLSRWVLPSAALCVGVLYCFHLQGSWPAIIWWKGIWPTIEGVVWAIFICTYIPIARVLPRLLSACISKIGLVSYSTYLLHVPILIFIGTHDLLLKPTGMLKVDVLITLVAVALPLVLLVSALSYYAIERPFLGQRVKYIR